MTRLPERHQFDLNYNNQTTQVVWDKVVSDTETPISASLKLITETEPFFLLESVTGGNQRERYSLIGLKPDLIWKCDATSAYISHQQGCFEKQSDAPLASLRTLHAQSACDIPDVLPPMASGLIGYMGYDAVRFVETTVPDNNPDSIGVPVGMFMRPSIMLIFDLVTGYLFFVTPVFYDATVSADKAYDRACQRIDSVKETLKNEPLPSTVSQPSTKPISFTSNLSKEAFKTMVSACQDYIVAGDVFQVVPSQRFESDFDSSPFSFYRSLRHLNPSPFLFFLQFSQFQLVGSSPEIMVRLRDNKVTIRPLAGTRPRGHDAQADDQLAKELLADKKEQSEHLMLVDLSRNDVGRVAQSGSVKVTETAIIEYYSHVMHIASNVEGVLDSRYDAFDALFSGLPVGTVSGAPKVRAMQIIDELEPQKRSFYAGCVGYFSANGDMDTCITLRTGLIKDNKLYIQAGCGVVADSDPETEYQETLSKAKALMEAAKDAQQFDGTVR